MKMSGAELHGECIDVQSEFQLNIALFIALASGIVTVLIMNVVDPLFSTLNLEDTNLEEGDKSKIGDKVVPLRRREDLIHEETNKIQMSGGHPCVVFRNKIFTHNDVPSLSMIELGGMIVNICSSSAFHVPRFLDPSELPQLTGEVRFDRFVFDLYNHYKGSCENSDVKEMLQNEYDNAHLLITMNRKFAISGVENVITTNDDNEGDREILKKQHETGDGNAITSTDFAVRDSKGADDDKLPIEAYGGNITQDGDKKHDEKDNTDTHDEPLQGHDGVIINDETDVDETLVPKEKMPIMSLENDHSSTTQENNASSSVLLNIADEEYSDDSDGGNIEIRGAEQVDSAKIKINKVLPISGVSTQVQSISVASKSPNITGIHKNLRRCLQKTHSLSLQAVSKMKLYTSHAQGFFQILHFIYDIIGRDTLSGVIFKHYIKINSFTHYEKSSEMNKNIATVLIGGFNLFLVFLAIITVGIRDYIFFSRMFATSLFFLMLMDTCVDLLTCFVLDFLLHNTVYNAVVDTKRRLRKHVQNIVSSKLYYRNKGVIKSNEYIETKALEEYVNSFSASRHFFVSYKNMLEYKQDSIEKAFILSYINPLSGNINEWSQTKYSSAKFLRRSLVYMVALSLKLPRAFHYVLLYAVSLFILVILLIFSQYIMSSGPYLILVGVFGLCLAVLIKNYRISSQFSRVLPETVRPSSASTDEDFEVDMDHFGDTLSVEAQEEIKRETNRRMTLAREKQSKVCMSCGEHDETYLIPFITIANVDVKKSNNTKKICKKCVNSVCQNCTSSGNQMILKQSRGDGMTICIDCVDRVCQKCKLQITKEDMVLRQSQHGRSMCRKCKMAHNLANSTPKLSVGATA